MNTHSMSRGLTFAESVIALGAIGILGTAVWLSLSMAQNTSRDGLIRSNLGLIAVHAGHQYSANSASYEGTCTFAPIKEALLEIGATCSDTHDAYAASASRPLGALSTYWCVDSRGTRCGTNSQHQGTACGACIATQ